MTADVDGLDSSVAHGLTDDAPDMPDGPLRTEWVFKRSLAALPTSLWSLRTPDDPPPPVPDRPPQRTLRA